MFNKRLRKIIRQLRIENEKLSKENKIMHDREGFLERHINVFKEENRELKKGQGALPLVMKECEHLRRALKDARENSEWYHVQYNDTFYQLRQAKIKLSEYEDASESNRSRVGKACCKSEVGTVPLGEVDEDADASEAGAECKS